MADTPDYAKGEPKPIPNGGASMHDLVIEDIQDRKDYGLNKYDSLLQAYNGRNFLQDMYEEIQDLIVYTRGALEEQERVKFFIQTILLGYMQSHDQAWPLYKSDVLIRANDLPGWLVQLTGNILGDRFEYSAADPSS